MGQSQSSFVGLLLDTPEEEKLWRGSLASQGVASAGIARNGGDLVDALGEDARMASAAAMIADANLINVRGVPLAKFAGHVRERFPKVALYVRLAARTGISSPEQAWARSAGISSLLPGSSVAAWQESLAPVLERVLEGIGRPKVDASGLERFLKDAISLGDEPRPGPVKDAHVDAHYLKGEGVNVGRILEDLRGPGGVKLDSRLYLGREYPDCFVASEAIDWLVANRGLKRHVALRAGVFLARTGRIHHVRRNADFIDGNRFFRFSGSRETLDRVDLVEATKAMRGEGGVPIADRTYMAKTYTRCFIGYEAVKWLMARHRLTLGEAETVGQRLLELGVLHHVLDEHGFSDAKYFYRFRADE